MSRQIPTEGALKEQSPLPNVSLDVAQPHHSIQSVDCPHCLRDVSESRGSHRLDVEKIAEPGIRARSIDAIPVYGWHCNHCNLILPLDSELAHAEPEVAPPFEGWIVIEITPNKGARIRGYAPAREVVGQ